MKRFNLLKAHGTTPSYWAGCRCVFCLAAGRDYFARYREANRDRVVEHGRRYSEHHPDRVRLSRARWDARHPEGGRARVRAHRAKLRGGGRHTAADVGLQLERQRSRCYWCGKKVGKTYHVDHVVPLALGGSNAPENLVVACPRCNFKKNAKHPMDFAGRMF